MTNEKTITVELDGMLGETRVEYESIGVTDISLVRINGEAASSYCFSDQVAVQSRLTTAIISGRGKAEASYE